MALNSAFQTDKSWNCRIVWLLWGRHAGDLPRCETTTASHRQLLQTRILRAIAPARNTNLLCFVYQNDQCWSSSVGGLKMHTVNRLNVAAFTRSGVKPRSFRPGIEARFSDWCFLLSDMVLKNVDRCTPQLAAEYDGDQSTPFQ